MLRNCGGKRHEPVALFGALPDAPEQRREENKQKVEAAECARGEGSHGCSPCTPRFVL